MCWCSGRATCSAWPQPALPGTIKQDLGSCRGWEWAQAVLSQQNHKQPEFRSATTTAGIHWRWKASIHICWRMASYPEIFDNVGIPLQNMCDFFALDITILMFSQRISSTHLPLPVTKNRSLQHSQQDGRKSTSDTCTQMHSLGNDLEISLVVFQYWSCFSPQQRDGLLRLISCGRFFWVFSTGNFLQSEHKQCSQKSSRGRQGK